MKLLICLITYNRLEYTQRTLESLLKTITVPHYIVAVDNASTDETKDWLFEQKKLGNIQGVIINPENYYPGKACNIGWTEGLHHYFDATHLMRCDNDMEFAPGWDKKAEEYFYKIPELGQLGIEHTAIEEVGAEKMETHINGLILNKWPGVVGGPNIIKREVWDRGARYQEIKWSHHGQNVPTPQEDSIFTFTIRGLGYLCGHMNEKLAWTFANESNWSDYPEYYRKTMEERGYKNIHKELFE